MPIKEEREVKISDYYYKKSEIDNIVNTINNNKISKTQTVGLVKNDGTIDTTTYSTFDGDYNSLINKPNTPTITNVTPTAETDINTYKTAGLYTFFNNTAVASMTSENKAKLPNGLGDTSFYLLVENKNAYAKQTLTQYHTGTTWIRIYNDNTIVKSWTSWTKLSIEGHTHDDRYYTESEVDTALSGKSDSTHTHTKTDITNFPSIPNKISDLQNDSDFIETSQTTGLIKNDGTIDTTVYSTFNGNYNSLTNKPNIPTITNVTPTAETDINTYKTAGLYTFFNNAAVASMTSENKAKLPNGLGDNSFYLLVESKSAYYAKQTLTQYSTGTTWIRTYNNSTWASWTKLSIEGHTHDDRYYTESEVNTALNGKSMSIEKQSTADTGYTATYILKQGGTALSPKINIPKDYLVKSGTLETVRATPTTLESTNNLTTGDKYLKFIVNTQENDDSTTLIIPVTDLIDTYTGDNTTIELNNGVFSVKSNVFANKTHTHSQYLTSHQDISGKANISDLATVATTGDYDDLIDKPNIPKVFYGTCSTGKNTQTKIVITDNNFQFEEGVILTVKFTNEQTFNADIDNPLKIRINSKTNEIKDVIGTNSSYNLRYSWSAGEVVNFVYDGTNFVLSKSLVTFNRTLNSGVKIGELQIDSNPKIDLFCQELNKVIFSINKESGNIKIDDEVILTITVKDYNDVVVSNKNVNITVDKGYFKANNQKTYSGATNSNGEIQVTYVASEWGIITFSANDVMYQCLVGGFRKTDIVDNNIDGSKIKFYLNEQTRQCVLDVLLDTNDYPNGFSINNEMKPLLPIPDEAIDSKYLPITMISTTYAYSDDMVFGFGRIDNANLITLCTRGDSAYSLTGTLHFTFYWNYIDIS